MTKISAFLEQWCLKLYEGVVDLFFQYFINSHNFYEPDF